MENNCAYCGHGFGWHQWLPGIIDCGVVGCNCKKFGFPAEPEEKATITETAQPEQEHAIDMIWANEAGKCFRFVECSHGRMRIEIYGIVDLKEQLLASATLEKHNRNRAAEAISYAYHTTGSEPESFIHKPAPGFDVTSALKERDEWKDS